MANDQKKTPRGIRNNNPLNILKGSSWKGERPTQTDPCFEEFVSMEYGIRAALKLMRNHITGFGGRRPKMNNLRKLIAVWAPPTENDTVSYLNFVCNHVDMTPSSFLDPNNDVQLCRIARAMAYVECGVWLDEKLFQSAWDLM